MNEHLSFWSNWGVLYLGYLAMYVAFALLMRGWLTRRGPISMRWALLFPMAGATIGAAVHTAAPELNLPAGMAMGLIIIGAIQWAQGEPQ